MSLTIALSEREERILAGEAEREGVSVAEYVRRRVLPLDQEGNNLSFAAMQKQVAEGFAASGMTEEELEEHVTQVVKQVRWEWREEAAK